jgi:catechol 2,3-dioxygenase-like lactoylglutathione lyase family enzyme
METTSAAKAEQPWSFKMVAPLEPGIVCIDMDRMLKFYTEVLGLQLVADAQTTPEMSTKFRATPHGYRIVRLQTPYGERIKLAQPKVPPVQNPVPEWVYERQGLAYFTFIVDDMKPILARLKANKVRLISEEPVEVRKGVFAQFVLDPEGNYVEFVEYPDIASYRPDLFKK